MYGVYYKYTRVILILTLPLYDITRDIFGLIADAVAFSHYIHTLTGIGLME